MSKKFEFAKNSLLLVIGTGVAQLLPLAVEPYLRRIFSVAEFGLYSQYFSIVSIVALCAGLKYDSSIMIPKSDRASKHLLVGTLFFNLMTSFVFLLVLFLVGHELFGSLGFSEKLSNYFWLMPISVFLISSNMAINYWLTRKKRFKGIVINKVSRRGAEAGSKVAFATKSVTGGIIFGTAIGDFVNLIVSLFQYKNSGGTFQKVRRKQVKRELVEQLDFPKYSLFPNMLNVVSSQMPVILFAYFYSDVIVGQLSGVLPLLGAPAALISFSLSQVLYQRVVDDVNNDRKILKFIRSNIFFLSGLTIVGVVVVVFFGMEIFTIYLGEEYVLAGKIGQILVFSYAIKFIVSPLSMTLIALKKLKTAAYWQVGYFLMTMSLFLFEDISVIQFVTYIVIIDLVSYFVYGFLIVRAARMQDRKVDEIIAARLED